MNGSARERAPPDGDTRPRPKFIPFHRTVVLTVVSPGNTQYREVIVIHSFCLLIDTTISDEPHVFSLLRVTAAAGRC